MPSPIALFVYDRLDHARRTVEAMQQNQLAVESNFFVADVPKSGGVKNLEKGNRNQLVDAPLIDGVTAPRPQYGGVVHFHYLDAVT